MTAAEIDWCEQTHLVSDVLIDLIGFPFTSVYVPNSPIIVLGRWAVDVKVLRFLNDSLFHDRNLKLLRLQLSFVFIWGVLPQKLFHIYCGIRNLLQMFVFVILIQVERLVFVIAEWLMVVSSRHWEPRHREMVWLGLNVVVLRGLNPHNGGLRSGPPVIEVEGLPRLHLILGFVRVHGASLVVSTIRL